MRSQLHFYHDTELERITICTKQYFHLFHTFGKVCLQKINHQQKPNPSFSSTDNRQWPSLHSSPLKNKDTLASVAIQPFNAPKNTAILKETEFFHPKIRGKSERQVVT
jgi:hypothetical protein